METIDDKEDVSRLPTENEPEEVIRLLDAQHRVFLPGRRSAGRRYFSAANSHPRETFVELRGPRGEPFLVRRVVEDFLTSDRSVKDVLGSISYFHDEMPTVHKDARRPGMKRKKVGH